MTSHILNLKQQNEPLSESTDKINHESIIQSLQVLTPIPFHTYLCEIYRDLSSRSDENVLTKLTFFSYYNLPGIINDRLFAVFDKSSKGTLTESDFITGMETLFCGDFEASSKLIFDFYDFDKDGKIYSEDIRTVLSYITLNDVSFNKHSKYKGRVQSQEELYVILDKCFKGINKPYLDYQSFQYVIENINSDIYFISILFLLESKPFSKATLKYFIRNDSRKPSNMSFAKNDKTLSPIASYRNSPMKMVASPTKNASFSPYKRFKKEHKRKTVVQNTTSFQKKFQMIINEHHHSNSNNQSKGNKHKFQMTCDPINMSEKITPFYEEEHEDKKKSVVIGGYQQMFFFNKDKPNPNNNNKVKYVISVTQDGNMNNNEHKINNITTIHNNNNVFKFDESDSGISPINNKHYAKQMSVLDLAQDAPQKIKDDKSDISSIDIDQMDLNQSDNESQTEAEDVITQEGYLYKLVDNKMKKVFFKLIHKDLYFYKSKSAGHHRGMHNLSGVFLTEEPILIHNNVNYYCFSIVFPSKKRYYYHLDENEFNTWIDKIKQAIGRTATVNDLYEIKSKVGKGKFGVVHLGINRKTKEKVAIKILDKTEMSTEDLELVRTEIEILKICQHPYIITLYDVFENPTYIHIIMEYCGGGDLFSYLEKRNFRLQEHKVCEFIHKTCSAVYYIHSYGVAHRDLKPENILMTSKDNNADIRILDFGLSKIIGPDEQCNEPYGTLAYVAPEILLDQPYTKMVDLWSIGVMTYSMLSGIMPFDDQNDEEIVRQIIKCQPLFVGRKWMMISKEAIDFVRRLLEKNPKERMGIKEALEHDWIKKFSGKDYVKEAVGKQNEKGVFELYSSAIQ